MLSERCSTTIRWQIRLEQKVRDKLPVPMPRLLCTLRPCILTRTYQAAGYYLGNQHVFVVQALARYMYLQVLSYEVSALPFSAAYFLVFLYRLAVSRGFLALADRILERLTEEKIHIGIAEDVQMMLRITYFDMIGNPEDLLARRTKLHFVIAQDSFQRAIWNELPEEYLEQWCRDSEKFKIVFLHSMVEDISKSLGHELDELD
jgi:hypothetical protein